METPQPTNILAVGVKSYPQNLLISGREDVVSLFLVNRASTPEKFKVVFQPEGLSAAPSVDFSSEYVDFGPNEQKEVEIRVTPTKDGRVQLTVTGYRQKRVEYIEKERRVKPAGPKVTPPQVQFESWGIQIPPLPNDEIAPYPLPGPSSFTEEALETEYQLATLSGIPTATTGADGMGLTDSLERDRKLADVATKYAEVNPVKFKEVFDQIGDLGIRNEVIPKVIMAMLPRFPEPALKMIVESYESPVREEQLRAWAHQLLGRGMNDALLAAEMVANQVERDQLVAHLLTRELVRDPNQAVANITKIQDGATRDSKRAEFSRMLAAGSPTLALKLLHEVEDPALKEQLTIELVKIFSGFDIDKARDLALEVANGEASDALLANLSLRTVASDYKRARELASSIKDPRKKFDTLLVTAQHAAKVDPVEGEGVFRECFSIARSFTDAGTKLETTSSVLSLLAKSIEPAKAHELVESLGEGDKAEVVGRIFDDIYHWVDVTKVRFEDELAVSLFYAFNALVTDVNQAIKTFSEAGGNVSENLLGGRYDSIISLLFMFPYNFALVPIIEQVYNEVQFYEKKEFFYIHYHSRNLTEGREKDVILSVLNRFLVKNAVNFSGTHIVFNLDFIPRLVRPTIIMGSDLEMNAAFESSIKRAFPNGDVDFIIDDGLFEGGKVFSDLCGILKPPKFKVLNLVLTYDFLSDLAKLKQFLLAFIR
ncbi:MAG: hypothetical protein ACTSU5_12590 [Promethearchaeota archaeon]